jgi:hypothetical protein
MGWFKKTAIHITVLIAAEENLLLIRHANDTMPLTIDTSVDFMVVAMKLLCV